MRPFRLFAKGLFFNWFEILYRQIACAAEPNVEGMPLTTVATRMLGIEHPIVCGGMTATGSAELAAGVSNAGGLGMLTCLHCRTPDNLAREIVRLRTMTGKPFGVNLTLLGEKRGEPEYPGPFVAVIVAAGVKIVETCGANRELMSRIHVALHEGGVEVIIHKCVKVSQAVRATEQLPHVSMISLMGFDSGGLPGEADTGIFVQAALAARALAVPFLLSGGVATGSQLTAALALGAAGVQIGTAFNATSDNVMFGPAYKERMVRAGVKDTVVVMSSFNASSRVFRGGDAVKLLAAERAGGGKAGVRAGTLGFKDIAPYAMFEALREGMEAGDPDRGVWNCGQSVALVDKVVTCGELVERLVREAEESLGRIGPMFQKARL